jgi:quinol monooxygenase YgiN
MHSFLKWASAGSRPVFSRGAAAGLLVAATMATAASAQISAAPVYAVTYLDVATGAVVKGVDLIGRYRDSSRRETANLEFTILQETSRPNRFAIVEGWTDQAAFEAHDKGAAKSAFEGGLKSIRNSPPDRHMLQPFANAPAQPEPARGALYLVEHVDFMGGDPAIAAAAEPLIKGLAEASRREPSVARYDIYRQPPPRINHYEVVAAWPDAKAFDAHETAAHTRQFRADTAKGGRAWRANLYDQRLYRVL